MRLNFSEVRASLGKIPLFLAHPTVESFFSEATSMHEIADWLESLRQNDIYFELNRSNFKQYLERPEFYKPFFNLAQEKGLKFTIGSDFHQIPGNYLKFYTKLCRIVELYHLRNFYNPHGQK
jgi:histidinol phosphatase-like PHP family hydrolase